jgi:hypothetical protein
MEIYIARHLQSFQAETGRIPIPACMQKGAWNEEYGFDQLPSY